jgi:phosphoglycolate phosphatase
MEDSPTAIVFDLDGVLVDSRVPISKSIDYALRVHGLPRPKLDHLERFIGPPLTIAFAELVGQPPDSPLVLACLASYRARYRDASLHETTVFPGIPEALVTLARSHRLAVATSKPLAFADPLLAALGLRATFEHVAGPDLDVNREDKQTTIGRVLSALDTKRAVMVGDRSFDIVGAHACGIPAIGVSWGIGDTDELAAAGAETIVNHPLDLYRAVGELLPTPDGIR